MTMHEPDNKTQRTVRGHHKASRHRVLGTLGIAAITYFAGCGGPIRSEPIISAAGPLIGIASLIVYPLLVTVPYAFIVAELCSAFPEDGGFAIWVQKAFGSFWGFQVGYWSWISGVFKGALLPGFLLQIVFESLGVEIKSKTLLYMLKLFIAVVLAVPSFVGTTSVERLSVSLLFVVLVPALVFTVWGYVEAIDYEDLWELRHETIIYSADKGDEIQVGALAIQWKLFLNTLFWSFDGVNTASLFGGEVANPSRVYSRAIALTIALTFATYIVPLPAAVVTDHPNWTLFTRNSYPSIARSIGGSTLESIIVVASVGSVVGLFVSGIFCKSFEMSGMADEGMLPSIFAKRNARFDSPHNAILVTLFFTVVLLGVDFDELVPMTNAFAGAVQLLILLSAMRLRQLLPYIPRPVRAPGGVRTLAALSIVPTIMLGYITVSAFEDWLAALIIVVFLVPGLVYGVLRFSLDAPSVGAPVA